MSRATLLSNRRVGPSTVYVATNHHGRQQANTMDPYRIRLREKLTVIFTLSTEAVSNKCGGLSVSPTVPSCADTLLCLIMVAKAQNIG